MGTDSREAKSLDSMQICLVAYIPREGYGLDHWRFTSRLGKEKSSCSHHQGSRNRLSHHLWIYSSWFRREFIAMSILIFMTSVYIVMTYSHDRDSIPE